MFYSKYWLLVSCLFCVNAKAADLGVIGNTYAIKETNALDDIQNRLKAMEKSGELKKKEQEAIKRSIHSVKNPKPVEGISTVIKYRTRLYDPTIVLDETVKTDEGTIIAPAGTRINPLDTINMSKSLVFFDGRDPEQIKAVRGLLDTYKEKVRPVLVAGDWFNLSKDWKRQVYFDQSGYLSGKFGITAVPAVIRQKGKFLEIAEIPALELK